MASSVIKRSSSSPNVRGMASTEASSTSLSDKRRNKLGYHRTSVACGQCTAQNFVPFAAKYTCSGLWLTFLQGTAAGERSGAFWLQGIRKEDAQIASG